MLGVNKITIKANNGFGYEVRVNGAKFVEHKYSVQDKIIEEALSADGICTVVESDIFDVTTLEINHADLTLLYAKNGLAIIAPANGTLHRDNYYYAQVFYNKEEYVVLNLSRVAVFPNDVFAHINLCNYITSKAEGIYNRYEDDSISNKGFTVFFNRDIDYQLISNLLKDSKQYEVKLRSYENAVNVIYAEEVRVVVKTINQSGAELEFYSTYGIADTIEVIFDSYDDAIETIHRLAAQNHSVYTVTIDDYSHPYANMLESILYRNYN